MTNENFDHTIKNVLNLFENYVEPEEQLEILLCMIIHNIHIAIDSNKNNVPHNGLIAEYYKSNVQDIFAVGEDNFRRLVNRTYMASKCLKKPIVPPAPPSDLDIFRAKKRYLEQIQLVGMGNHELADDIMGRFSSR